MGRALRMGANKLDCRGRFARVWISFRLDANCSALQRNRGCWICRRWNNSREVRRDCCQLEGVGEHGIQVQRNWFRMDERGLFENVGDDAEGSGYCGELIPDSDWK